MTLPNITIQNIIDLLRDLSRNQNLETTRALRVINVATDLVLTQYGLPSQEKEYSFFFDETQPTYSLPEAFGEPLWLRFDDEKVNKQKRWTYRPAEFLYERIEAVGKDTRLWGLDYASGNWRLYVLGYNSTASLPIDTFDYGNAANWIASNDATNVADDNIIYEEGSGSLKFDITPGLSGLDRATLTRTVSATDLSNQVDAGYFKCDCYLQNITNFTSISFNWGSSGSNYYKTTVTTQQDGTAFAVGWNDLSFAWLGTTQVGTPDPQQITKYWFDFDYTAAYTGGTSFRLDDLRLSVPDEMILNYYTRQKGVSSLGAVLYDFTAVTDKFLFPTFDLAPRMMVALYAALMLNPQILVENTSVKEQYAFYSKEMSRKYPRKRINNFIAEPTLPNTD